MRYTTPWRYVDYHAARNVVTLRRLTSDGDQRSRTSLVLSVVLYPESTVCRFRRSPGESR